uniref:Uncharacterized protein n=1 Tax=Hucho hucho TaxID=62062 RepID=A0A4W5K234_9TELE
MARPFTPGGGNTVIKPVTYAPKVNTPASAALASMLQPHNGHGLRVDGIPMFIPNDRSKKRLIEDTQDWQPRTGTTQSRSFRMLAQLTGTDYSESVSGPEREKSVVQREREVSGPERERSQWSREREVSGPERERERDPIQHKNINELARALEQSAAPCLSPY